MNKEFPLPGSLQVALFEMVSTILDKAGSCLKFLSKSFFSFRPVSIKPVQKKVPQEVSSMEGNIANLVILLIWAASILLSAFVIQSLLIRRAAFKVIRIFQDNHSLCSEGYKTIKVFQPPYIQFFRRVNTGNHAFTGIHKRVRF